MDHSDMSPVTTNFPLTSSGDSAEQSSLSPETSQSIPSASTAVVTSKVYSRNTARTCQCQDFVFGNVCSFGQNDLTPQIALPTRNASITLEIFIDFQDAFKTLGSPESLAFIKKLQPQLEALCKKADPEAYKAVEVVKLTNGSIVSESVVQYNYLNNETQIQFLNNQLERVLTDILNDTRNLVNISQVFRSNVSFNRLMLQPPLITSIADLKPLVNCYQFANYTAEISDGVWRCAGPCKTNPDYCHQHGDCLNDIYKGPVCSCYQNSLEQYHGPRCEFVNKGPGFYGALFGSLAVVLLIIIIITIFVVRRRHKRRWKINQIDTLPFEEDFFDFTNRRNRNFGFQGTYNPKRF
ncbi:hypothetical protein CHARACLAT_011565 [Characodon lateralis]|uniref:Uncharacterized protein n=1 Tax=Characodon lateralis TaxID=208331 RepID=A0ABU7DQX9_9TELE|nr:hypothetical protein [Characodon lateralis]